MPTRGSARANWAPTCVALVVLRNGKTGALSFAWKSRGINTGRADNLVEEEYRPAIEATVRAAFAPAAAKKKPTASKAKKTAKKVAKKAPVKRKTAKKAAKKVAKKPTAAKKQKAAAKPAARKGKSAKAGKKARK